MSTVDPSSRRPGELRNACASNARLVFGSIPNSHFPDPEISVWMRAFENTVQSCRTTRSRELFIFSLPMRRIVLGVIAMALTMRTGWPARHPSPKNSPGPSIATTASLPV